MSMFIKILNWLRARKEKGGGQTEDEFVDIESPSIVHHDPEIEKMLMVLSHTKREMQWASWKIHQLEEKASLSEFERLLLESLPAKLKKLARLYRSQNAELRKAQNSNAGTINKSRKKVLSIYRHKSHDRNPR